MAKIWNVNSSQVDWFKIFGRKREALFSLFQRWSSKCYIQYAHHWLGWQMYVFPNIYSKYLFLYSKQQFGFQIIPVIANFYHHFKHSSTRNMANSKESTPCSDGEWTISTRLESKPRDSMLNSEATKRSPTQTQRNATISLATTWLRMLTSHRQPHKHLLTTSKIASQVLLNILWWTQF